MYNFYPSNSKVQRYYKKYCSQSKNKAIQQSNKGKKSPLKSFDYNAKLATITMYRLLYSQKRYEDALALLTILAKNKKLNNAKGKEKVANMIKVASLTRKGFTAGDISTVMSPRTVLNWCSNAGRWTVFSPIAYIKDGSDKAVVEVKDLY